MSSTVIRFAIPVTSHPGLRCAPSGLQFGATTPNAVHAPPHIATAAKPPKRTTSKFRCADSGRGLLHNNVSIDSGLAARSTWQINGAQISGALVDAHVEEQTQHVSGVLRTAHGEALIREADHLTCQSWSERMKERAETTLATSTYGEPRLAISAGPCYFDLSQPDR